MGRFKAWLSPGTVLGSIALIVALGGTGYAASGPAKHHPKHHTTTHILSTSDVRRIAADEIKKAAPKLSVGHASTASTANTANNANSAKIATNVLSANVNADGSLLGSIPTGATSSRANVGDYRSASGARSPAARLRRAWRRTQVPR